jgi:TonB family protein
MFCVKTRKRRLLGALAGLALAAAAAVAQEDFSETQLRHGREAFRQRRYAEAIDLFRIAAFGFLDRPARLAEALARQSVAQHEAGRTAEARLALERLLELERKTSATSGIRLEPEVKEIFRALVMQLPPESLLSASSLAGLLGLSGSPAVVAAPPQVRSPTALARPPAPPVVTATPTPSLTLAPTPAPTVTVTAPPAPTVTPTRTATATPKPTSTRTPAPTSTSTRIFTATATASLAPIVTATPSPSPTAFHAPAPTGTPRPRAEPAPGTGAGAIARPEEVDEPPRLKRSVSPVYPPAALRERVRGLVLLRVLVSETGEPVEIRVLEPARDDLTKAAVEAIRAWRFEPARKDGAAVRTWVTIRVPFEAIAFAPGPATWAGLIPAATASRTPTQSPTPFHPQ